MVGNVQEYEQADMLLVVEFENHLHNHQLPYSDNLKMLAEWVDMQIVVVDNSMAVGHLDMEKLVVDMAMVDIGLVQLTTDTWMDSEHTDWTEVGTDLVVVVGIDLLEEDMGSVEGS